MPRTSRYMGALALLTLGADGCSHERQPKDYDECVLRYVKAGMDRAAVSALQESCRAKFPAGGSSRDLTAGELAALDGRASPSSIGSHYSGQLYNGNRGITVTGVRVRVTTKIGGKEDSRVYEDKVSIAPRATGRFFFAIIKGDQGANYEWSLEGATGVPSG